MRRLAVILLVQAALVAAVPLSAQRSFGLHFSPQGRSVEPRYGPRFFSPLPLYSGLYYSDLLDAGYPVASQPPVFIVQSAPQAASASDTASSPTEPLLIELQDGRYVRLSGEANAGVETIDRVSVRHEEVSKQKAEPIPALLVFRDGHKEEVSGYTIADGMIYAGSDYSANGAWTRKIELSSLNLTDTVESNKSRGVRFQLPTASNIVIVGP